jgi:hypothetical protein
MDCFLVLQVIFFMEKTMVIHNSYIKIDMIVVIYINRNFFENKNNTSFNMIYLLNCRGLI